MMDEELCRELLELVLGFRIAKVTVSREKSFVYPSGIQRCKAGYHSSR